MKTKCLELAVVFFNLVSLVHIFTPIQSSYASEVHYKYEDSYTGEDEFEEITNEIKARNEIERNIVESPSNFTVASDGSQSIVFRRQVTNIRNITLPFMQVSLDGGVGPYSYIEKQIVNETVENSVKYKLYNFKMKVGEVLTYGNKGSNRKCIPGKNTVFLIHGYLQSGVNDPVVAPVFETALNIKNAYIESNRSENVIIVNWELKANQLNYIAAAMDTYLVGIALGHMIIFLKTEKCFDYNQVKLVGFSLGAHVAGVAGHFINEKLQIKVAEITGLDPAGPLFDPTLNVMYRLDKTDANFVQIIHCNMGNIFGLRVGSMVAAGHADFYPNGGSQQLKCDLSIRIYSSICSHLRCGELYASTVRGVRFSGCPCEDVENFMRENCTLHFCKCSGPPMGDLCNVSATGKFCLNALPHILDMKLH